MYFEGQFLQPLTKRHHPNSNYNQQNLRLLLLFDIYTTFLLRTLLTLKLLILRTLVLFVLSSKEINQSKFSFVEFENRNLTKHIRYHVLPFVELLISIYIHVNSFRHSFIINFRMNNRVQCLRFFWQLSRLPQLINYFLTKSTNNLQLQKLYWYCIVFEVIIK